MEAQQKPDSTAGEYYLSGVRETASGFKLNPDHTFEFFFSYGALDRSGTGTWKKVDDQVIFNSPAPKGQHFAMITNKAVNNEKITIKIMEQNSMLASNVYCILKSGDKEQEEKSNNNGEISFPKQPVDSIILIQEFCPEKAAFFACTNRADNYFEFKLEPWAMEVFFENLSLTIDEKGLKGRHPLLKEGEYNFIKQ